MSFPNCGKESVAMARQCCVALGKWAHCQVATGCRPGR
ncbi:hypothetical protein [Streptomyces violaceusniger]